MIPEGELLRSRVVTSLSAALKDVLDRRLDGYALLSPRDSILGSGEEARGVITFEAGVPTLAYHAGTDRGGPPAVADIGPPPYQFELYAVDGDELELPHRAETLRVPPGSVAERLAGDPDLAERIRAVAEDRDSPGSEGDIDALEAFLEDGAAVEEIRRTARENARDRAEEWGFSEAIGE